MLKLHLAFLVIEKRITLEQAIEIDKTMGSRIVPDSIEDIIKQLEEILHI